MVQASSLPNNVLRANLPQMFVSKDNQEILRMGNIYSLLYVGIGLMAGVCSFFQRLLGLLAGDSFSIRIRKLVFKNMLEQDMTFFDEPENSVGNLTARLSTDATGIQGVRLLSLLTLQ
jgi:ABC-type multidrug transport system fused ATPase/permease subunit